MKTHLQTVLLSVGGALFLTCAVNAQVSSGAPYTLEQSVIASGGESSGGGAFVVAGTIGQSIAGQTASNSPYTLNAGFWASPTFAPTAAGVTLGGRILTLDGAGLRNARVTLTDARGNSRAVSSGVRGAFRFTDVAAGETYIVAVVARRYVFQPQVIFALEDRDDLVLTAAERTGTEFLQP